VSVTGVGWVHSQQTGHIQHCYGSSLQGSHEGDAMMAADWLMLECLAAMRGW